MDLSTERIRALNDELRRNLPGGHAVMTAGVAALGPEAVARIVKTIAVYDDFCHANDPYEEHDFGSFEADGQRIFFKIDYFDKALNAHSPDPSDPSVTERVITIIVLTVSVPSAGTEMSRALTTPELRRAKPTLDEFFAQPRRPITVVLDGVTQNYNIGAIFRLCDAFLVQQLVICGTKVELRKRKLVQAAQGTQHGVPWSGRQHASQAVAESKARGAWVVVAEQTTASVRPEQLMPAFPACLVLGGERSGVSPQVIDAADAAVAIPMLGMANSLNVATAAAILLYWLSLRLEENIGP